MDTCSPAFDQSTLTDIFNKVDKDSSGKIDIRELHQALTAANYNTFNPETCQLLLGLFDQNQDGEIDIAEFSKLLLYIKQWKTSFTHFDKDCNGVIDAEELHETLKSINCEVSPRVCALILTRYDPVNKRSLTFDNFIRCCVHVQALSRSFTKRLPALPSTALPRTTKREVSVGLEEFLTMVIESRPKPVETLAFNEPGEQA